MVTKIADVTPYKPGQKVISTTELASVPEGTKGKVKVSNGATWARYWVMFDNGEWVGQVDHREIVPVGQYDQFKRDEAARAARGADGETGDPAPELDEGAESDAGGGRIPEHLLERSRKARARLTGGS